MTEHVFDVQKTMDFSPPTNTRKWDTSVMKLNVTPDIILENIAANIQKQLPQHVQHEEQGQQHLAVVGGGWSLEEPEVFEELRELYFRGVKLVALNGSANWLMERNLKPAIHIVMDARPANFPFIEKPIPGCKYFLASQCHPTLVDACIDRNVRLFHVISSDSEKEREILDNYYNKRWLQVPGAGTVGIVSIMLLRMIGFKFQHLFGIDSCYSPKGTHHAYPQALNDDEGWATFWCAGRAFRCSAWQASQVHTFQQVIKHHGPLLQLEIHGDGLLAHVLRTGAALQDERDASGMSNGGEYTGSNGNGMVEREEVVCEYVLD